MDTPLTVTQVTPEEELFFIAEALRNGQPNRRIKYDENLHYVIHGDLWLGSFGDRAVKAGLHLKRSRGRCGDSTYEHDGGMLYERYKRWYVEHYL